MSQVPAGLKYSKEHEWVRLDGNTAFVGITDFAQDELGDIVFVELPEVGSVIHVNDTFGTVESVKTVSDLFAPVSGKVIRVNKELEGTPEKVNTEPYDGGWMVAIEVTSPSDLDNLLDEAAYKSHIEE